MARDRAPTLATAIRLRLTLTGLIVAGTASCGWLGGSFELPSSPTVRGAGMCVPPVIDDPVAGSIVGHPDDALSAALRPARSRDNGLLAPGGRLRSMAEVITLVTGDIPPNRAEALEEAYRELVRGGLGPALEDTFLVRAAGDRVGILTLWHRRADLDALLASGEEPPARRLIRSHGGEPEVTIWQVAVRGTAVAGADD